MARVFNDTSQKRRLSPSEAKTHRFSRKKSQSRGGFSDRKRLSTLPVISADEHYSTRAGIRTVPPVGKSLPPGAGRWLGPCPTAVSDLDSESPRPHEGCSPLDLLPRLHSWDSHGTAWLGVSGLQISRYDRPPGGAKPPLLLSPAWGFGVTVLSEIHTSAPTGIPSDVAGAESPILSGYTGRLNRLGR